LRSLLCGVWFAVRGDGGAERVDLVEPRASEPTAARPADGAPGSATRRAVEGQGEAQGDGRDERVGIDAAPPLRIDEPPGASTEVVPSADLARGRTQAGLGAPAAPLVWSFADALEHEALADGGLELALSFEAGRTPTPEDPWRVRGFGATAGGAPRELFDLRFDGTRAPRFEVTAAALAAHAQVYVLRADWRGEPARYVAVCAAPGFDRTERIFSCPEESALPCTITAFWGLGSNGSLVPRTVSVDPEKPLRVDARYASLFPPP
jgi:hypothetical protein